MTTRDDENIIGLMGEISHLGYNKYSNLDFQISRRLILEKMATNILTVMKKYSQKNWNLLIIACVLGFLFAAYKIYSAYGKLDSNGITALGIIAGLILIILFVVNKFYRERS